MSDASIKESEDSNEIICELVGQENYVEGVKNMEDTENNAQTSHAAKKSGRKLLKYSLSKATFSLYCMHCILFHNV